jgi:YNFM family putative membrane transporter
VAAGVPQALFSPFSGLLSDRLGRRPMIVTAFASVGVLSLTAALTPGFAALLAIRFLAGLLGSLAPSSLMASVGDLFPAERRARAMGWFNMGFSFAAIGGVPVMGALGGALGWRWAFAAIGVVMLVLTAACGAGSRASRPRPPARASRRIARSGVARLLNLLGANPHGALALRTGGDLPARLSCGRFQLSAVGWRRVLVLVALGAIGR